MKKLLATGAALLAIQSGNVYATKTGTTDQQAKTNARIVELCDNPEVIAHLKNPREICGIFLDGKSMRSDKLKTILGGILLSSTIAGAGVYMRRRKKHNTGISTDENGTINHVPGFDGESTIEVPETNESDSHEMIDRVMILAGIIPQSIRDILPGLDPRATPNDIGIQIIDDKEIIYPNHFMNEGGEISLNRAYELKNGREIVLRECVQDIHKLIHEQGGGIVMGHERSIDGITVSFGLGYSYYDIIIQGDGEFYYLTNEMGRSMNKDAEIIEGTMIPMDLETVKNVISKLIHNPQDDIPTLDEIIPTENIDVPANTVDASNSTNNAIEELQKTAESDLNSLIANMTESKKIILDTLKERLQLHNLSDPVANFDILVIIPQAEFGEIGATFYQELLITENEIQRIQQQIEVASVNHQADPNNLAVQNISQESLQSCIDTMKILSQEIIEDRNIFLLGIENEAKKMEITQTISNNNNELLSDSIDFDLSDPYAVEDIPNTEESKKVSPPVEITAPGLRRILGLPTLKEVADKKQADKHELDRRALQIEKHLADNTVEKSHQEKPRKSKLHLIAKTPEEFMEDIKKRYIKINKRINNIYTEMSEFINEEAFALGTDINVKTMKGNSWEDMTYTLCVSHDLSKDVFQYDMEYIFPGKDPVLKSYTSIVEFREYMLDQSKMKYDNILENRQQ